jgi:hypothetical protein
MTWKGELPKPEIEAQPPDPLGLRICRVLTYVFAFVTVCWIAFSASIVYWLPGVADCTLEELSKLVWREFVYGPVWPLLATGVTFMAWRVLARRAQRMSGGGT